MKPLILGLYGLSKNQKNISGYSVINNEESIKILKKAWDLGIRYLDTAPSYGAGNADYLIKSLRELNCNFKIIAKVGLDVQKNIFREDNHFLKKELIKLKENHNCYIHSVLLHSPTKKFISDKENLLTFFKNVKSIFGKDIRIGVSLRDPKDFEKIDNLYEFDGLSKGFLIESNLSWFDLRILNYLNKRNEAKFQIMARSIYASGILNIISSEKINQKYKFSESDIRSTWNFQKLFNNNQDDIQRIKNVEQILKNASVSEIGFSLFPILSSLLFGIIIGPLSIKELIDSDKSYKKNLSENVKNNLKKIIDKYNTEFSKICLD